MNSITAVRGRWYRSNKFHLCVLASVFVLAAFSRFWAASLSTGPDVAQFWAFAKLFQAHGLDFYRYADATDASLPFAGWRFVYPPIWLLILRISLLAAPGSFASANVVDPAWRLAMKTPIILADLAIGALIYWAVPGSKWKKLLFASVWLLHPTGWFESGVFGQFDAIAGAFLLAAVVMLGRGKDRLAFLFAGLALMTKQYTFLPIVLMIAVSTRQMKMQRLISNLSITFAVVILLSVPFLVTGNFGAYAHSVFMPGWSPDYQNPLSYVFSGSSSLLTYLQTTYGWEISGILHFNMYILAFAMLAAIVLSRIIPINPEQAALVGMLLFIGISYQVNYQYLVAYIPLAILVASQAANRGERTFALVMALMPAVWLWLFDVSFWFRALQPAYYGATHIFAHIGWVAYVPDYAYVIFAVTLMCLCLSYTVLIFARWHDKNRSPVSPTGSILHRPTLPHPDQS